MFEAAELGHAVDKETYDRESPKLREALLDAQFDLLEQKKFRVLVLIGGVDGAGKGETVNLLNEWLDPRHIHSYAFAPPTKEERGLPEMARYIAALPPLGEMSIFFGSWYTAPILGRATGKTKRAALEHSVERITRVERMLTDDNTLILKFWFHLSKSAQKKRLHALEDDPLTAWRVTSADWARFKQYEDFREVAEKVVRETSTGEAPWQIVEGVDERYRSLTVGQTILAAMRKRLDDQPSKKGARADRAPAAPSYADKNVLSTLDLDKSLPKKTYEKKLAKLQRDLGLLSRDPRLKERSVVIAYEGSDAAGKGGNIRRVTAALDARHYHVIPIAAPKADEKAMPYLWRFWQKLPRRGRFAIFDRTWYGRVLVERVEGFATEAEWQRAYGEINDFEEQLDESGAIVVKFWLQISKEEQLARFKAREKTGFKRYKITEEDYRNRKKWDEYEAAVGEMVERTSTDIAPWTLVEANDKHFARVKTLERIVERLEERL